MIVMQREIFDKLDCAKVRYSQGRFIAEMRPLVAEVLARS